MNHLNRSHHSTNSRPPKLAERFLRQSRTLRRKHEIMEDLEDLFHRRVHRKGRFHAWWLYWRDTLSIGFRIALQNEYKFDFIGGPVMLKNYFKIAFRRLRKQKAFSFINISGLAIGMACCILISLYVADELSYDQYHENADRIYRVERSGTFNGQDFYVPVTGHPYGPAMQNDYPEVEAATRFWPLELPVKDRNNQYFKEEFWFADANVFEVFSFQLLKGDKASVLAEPNSIVLTEQMARRYFGPSDPIDKLLTLQWSGQDIQFKVTGVMAQMPQSSHFITEFFISYTTLKSLLGEQQLGSWFNNGQYTYILLEEGVDPKEMEQKFIGMLEKYMGPMVQRMMPDTKIKISDIFQIPLRPITEIYLHSDLEFEPRPTSSMTTIYVLSLIAVLVLFIACINFMNLSTARSVNRANEVGVRKVVGAERKLLITQFLGESTIQVFVALVFAIVLVLLVLPAFNDLSGKALSLEVSRYPLFAGAFAAIALFVGVFSGIYPAFFLSSFNPVNVLKGKSGANMRGANALRKVLVVAQFAISICLIFATLVIVRQLDYLKNKKLGFDKEQVVAIPLRDNAVRSQIEPLKNRLLQNSAVIEVASSTQLPGDNAFSDQGYWPSINAADMDNFVSFIYFSVDEKFLPLTKIELAAGRNFSKAFATDSAEAVIINQAAIARLGWGSANEALGKSIYQPTALNPPQFRELKVVGVTEDFHFKSLHQKIEPLIIHMTASNARFLSVRVQTRDISETIEFLEREVGAFSPNYPFEYFFLDSHYDELYRAEEKLQHIFRYFTFLAIFIACLGLFGLAAYAAEQRTKEIGVRKVLGATVPGLFHLLSKDFIKLVLFAAVLAWPAGWFAMRAWLQDFHYRIDMTASAFLISGALAILIALVAISYQSVKAALTNPIDALRYE